MRDRQRKGYEDYYKKIKELEEKNMGKEMEKTKKKRKRELVEWLG
ncbi:hypothetical protein AGMMS49921_01620 [Endomicrobiia bacterium]|nr:hypothetical protein AGMMS49921_01620 [Endomicrobiia bacterium]